MHPEVQELSVKLKEILYDAAVDVRATKAALYLLDVNAHRYELAAEFGFRGAIAPWADEKNPIVDRCNRGRNAFYVNGLMAEPRFSEILYESSTDRLLVAPIYLRGQLVGLIDMRDKASKQPFEAGDLPAAQRIADRIGELFANKNVFGQRFITLSGREPLPAQAQPSAPGPAPSAPPNRMPTPTPPPAAPPVAASSPAPQPALPEAQATSYVPRVSSLILEARTAADRIAGTVPPEIISETELVIVREILRAVLLIPGATVAAFSAFGHLGGIQEIAARGPVSDDGMTHLQSKINSWLSKRGDAAGTTRPRMHMPFGTDDSSVSAAQMKKVFTAPITAGTTRGLYLTVAFAGDPERSLHELLAAFHQQLQLAIEQSMSRRSADLKRLQVANRLLEPDFSRFPELRRHANAVVARTDAFARFLGLTPAEIETARIVALLHDLGMRLLEYDRLYRKRDLSPDDLAILREHPVVGAAIVEPFLGPEIARAILCHHERFDGRGYPNELAGEDIPLMSRIIQLCDTYEAMVAVDTYQPAQTHEAAMAVIERGAESQFDPNLAGRFEEMMRTAAPAP